MLTIMKVKIRTSLTINIQLTVGVFYDTVKLESAANLES